MASWSPLILLLLCFGGVASYNLEFHIIRAFGLTSKPDGEPTNSFVRVTCRGVVIGETSVQYDTVAPLWNQKFYTAASVGTNVLIEMLNTDGSNISPLMSCRLNLKWGMWNDSCTVFTGGALFYAYTLK
uniref:C2 domain-containing protein n=1 Tax=Gouania willdenowi TaxID=441366 RepID=A0A8C5DVM4_GOUWI